MRQTIASALEIGMELSNNFPLSNPELKAKTDAAIPRHAPATPEQDGARVEISSLNGLESTQAGNEVRQDKVNEIKSAIDDGSFRIDTVKVAERMINESASLVQLLIGGNPGDQGQDAQQPNNSQEKFGAGPANERRAGPDR